MAVQPGAQRQLGSGEPEEIAAREQAQVARVSANSALSTGDSVAVTARTRAEKK